MGMYSGYHGSILATSKPRLEKPTFLARATSFLSFSNSACGVSFVFPRVGSFSQRNWENHHIFIGKKYAWKQCNPFALFLHARNLTVLVGQHLESCCLKMGHLYRKFPYGTWWFPVDFLRHLCPLGCSLLHHVLPPCPFGEIVPFWTKLGVQFQFELVKWYTTIVMLYRVLLYYIMFYPNSCCLSPGLLPIKPKKYPGREPLRLCVPSRPPTSHHEASATPVGELLPLGPLGPHLIGPQTNCWMWWVNVKEKIIRLYIAKFGYNGSVHGVS